MSRTPIEFCLRPSERGVCGRASVALEVVRGQQPRPVCRAHAPWFGKQVGAKPGTINPSPCCAREMIEVYSSEIREKIPAWERCSNCNMTFRTKE